MKRALLLGALLGGVVAFAWSFISWDVLSWHENQMYSFQDEDAVGRAIMDHAPQSGMYLYPAGGAQPGMSREQRKAAQAVAIEKMKQGPIVFAAVRREPFGSYASGILKQLGGQIIAAFLLTWLLLETRGGLSYWRRVQFLATVGLAASVICDWPNWTWWSFSGGYTMVQTIDAAVTWLLAGLVIAAVAKPRTSMDA
jgi:hypothetical protein